MNLDSTSPFCLSLRRIYSLVLRNVFILTSSWPRVIELVYWPMLNIIIWGFLNFYLSKQVHGVGYIAGVLLATAIFWEIYNRSYLGMLFPFLEELWSRNVGQLFVSPIKPVEYLGGLITLSFLRTFIAIIPCVIVAWFMFDYWLFDIGFATIAYYIVLSMTGWWCGCLILSLLLKYGLAAEWLAWMFGFTLTPLAAVYYPVSVLPEWLQPLSWLLPPTYAFEGLRALLNDHIFRVDYMLIGFGLNLFYTLLSGKLFLYTFEQTRRKDGLLHTLND